MARPLKEIDAEQVRELAELGCLATEIGAILGCSTDTLFRRFTDELAAGKAALKHNLRRAQIQAALAGNATMLIWLGKTILGQRDHADVPPQKLTVICDTPYSEAHKGVVIDNPNVTVVDKNGKPIIEAPAEAQTREYKVVFDD